MLSPCRRQPGCWVSGSSLQLQGCLQLAPAQALSSLQLKRKSLQKAKERIRCSCRNWCLFLTCLPAYFVQTKAEYYFYESMLSFGIDTNECKAFPPLVCTIKLISSIVTSVFFSSSSRLEHFPFFF